MNVRPIAPHLQIYRLPLAAIISIVHRFVGAALFTATVVTAIYCVLWTVNINLNWLNGIIFSWFGKLKLSGLTAMIVFYALAEIRYILWGVNIGLSPTFVHISNGLILAFTGVFSVLCWTQIWG